jgi:hypothetical protein
MYCLPFNVLSVLIVEDRQYIEEQTIHWRIDNTLEDRQYIVEDRQYIEEVRQYIVEDRQYIEGQTIHWRTGNTLKECIVCPPMYCLSSNVLSVLQCIVCPL